MFFCSSWQRWRMVVRCWAVTLSGVFFCRQVGGGGGASRRLAWKLVGVFGECSAGDGSGGCNIEGGKGGGSC